MGTSVTPDSDTLAFYEQAAPAYQAIRSRPIQVYTHDWEAELLQKHVGGCRSVLDLGCGEGRTTRLLGTMVDGTVVGSDFSSGMVRVAQSLPATANVRYQVNDAQAMSFPDGSFDAVVAITTLNYVPDVSLALREVRRVLKPGGKFVCSVINSKESARFARALYLAPLYAMRWLGIGANVGFRRYYSRREVLDAASPSFRLVHYQGMRFLPDWIPEAPFNLLRPFFPFTRVLLNGLEPIDRALCARPPFAAHARFHFCVFEAAP
jgi:ubiquinone/menaquinone biosynthesis C-methylase UbiE